MIAPSTSQDPECRLLRVALEALADEPVRVLATSNRHRPEEPVEVPANAVLVPWMRYSQAFPAADVVVCHGGHGTVAGALAAGAPPLVWPAVGDQGESRARVAWSGVAPPALPLAAAGRRLLGHRARAEEMRLARRTTGRRLLGTGERLPGAGEEQQLDSDRNVGRRQRRRLDERSGTHLGLGCRKPPGTPRARPRHRARIPLIGPRKPPGVGLERPQQLAVNSRESALPIELPPDRSSRRRDRASW